MKRLAGLVALMMVVCLSIYGCNTSANLLVAKDRKALVGTWTWEMSPEELIDAITTGLEEQAEFQARVARHEAHRNAHAGHDHAGHDHAGHDHAGHDHAGHDHAGHDHAGHDHAGHDHAGHDHEGHDHANDHEGHDHANDHEGSDQAAAPVDEATEGEGVSLTPEQQEELSIQLREETMAEIVRQLAESGIDDVDGSIAQEVFASLEPTLLDGQIRLPAPEGMFPRRTIPNAVIRQTFNADGSYQLNIAGQSFFGNWDMPNQSGSPRRVVVTFEQEGIRQRLIQLIDFKADGEIVISDEMGVSKVFKRQ